MKTYKGSDTANYGIEVQISAPVYIPPMEFVPIETVYKLEEYRSDQIRWEAILWTFVGGTLGIIANWITSDTFNPSKPSIVLLVVFILLIAILGFATNDFRKRADRMKASFLSGLSKTDKQTNYPEKVTVTLTDLLTGKIVTAELPTNAPIGRLLPAIVAKLELPIKQYQLLHVDKGRVLNSTDTLFSAEAKTGDTFWILPQPPIFLNKADTVPEQKEKNKEPIIMAKKEDLKPKEKKEVTISLMDFAGSKLVQAKVSSDVPMARLIPALLRKLNIEGKMKLEHKRTGSVLSDDMCLSDIGVQDGDTLRLIPVNNDH